MKAPNVLVAVALSVVVSTSSRASVAEIEAKLDAIVFPEFKLPSSPLAAAVDAIRERLAALDKAKPDESERAMRISIELGFGWSLPFLVELEEKEITLRALLQKVAEQTERTMVVDQSGVKLMLGGGGIDRPEGLFIRRYSIQPKFLEQWNQQGGDGIIDDPFATGEEEEQPRLRKIIENGEVLSANGITFPEGASAFFNPNTNELVMLNDQPNHELLKVLIENVWRDSPKRIHVRAEVYELPLDRFLPIKEQSIANADYYPAVQRILSAGDAKLIAMPAVQTRSGQRAKVSSGRAETFVSKFEVKDGRDHPVEDSVFVGNSFEIDPVLAADDVTMDINFALSLSTGELEVHDRSVLAPVSGTLVPARVVTCESDSIITSTVVLDRQPTFVGTIGKPTSEAVRLVFLIASVQSPEYWPVFAE